VNTLNIGLNLLHAHEDIGGVWNYIKNVVQMIAAYDSENKYIAFVSRQSDCLVQDTANMRKVHTGINGRNRQQRVIYEQTVLGKKGKEYRLDCMHWFANTRNLFSKIPSIVTLHDLLVYKDPAAFRFDHRLYLKTFIPRSLRRSAAIIAVSERTGREITLYFKDINRDRIFVVSSPIGYEFCELSQDETECFKKKYRLPEHFWLYVANVYPHKNHGNLFRAYSDLVRKSPDVWPLVLRGEKGGAADTIEKMLADSGIRDRIVWLPRLKNDEMPALYSSATALIFPSLYEGGGIPVMEAMACGCPVVASDIEATREFAGDAALTFDPEEVRSIAAAMERFAADGALRAACREKASRKIAELRPEKAFSRLLDVYKFACNGK